MHHAMTALPAEGRFPWEIEPLQVQALSSREREVFALLGVGLSNRHVARALGVTELTVKTHVGRVLAKLKLESRLQAGLAALLYLAQQGSGQLLPGDHQPAGLQRGHQGQDVLVGTLRCHLVLGRQRLRRLLGGGTAQELAERERTGLVDLPATTGTLVKQHHAIVGPGGDHVPGELDCHVIPSPVPWA
jgi:DNA-binding CsgD family transcriptional regulator